MQYRLNYFFMATTYTDLWQKDAVLKMFDQQKTPYYEVLQGKDLKFDSIDHCDDIEDAKAYLTTQLDAIEHFGSPAQFRINFYRGVTDKNKLDQLKASNTFKLNENGAALPGTYWGNRNGLSGAGGNNDLQDIKEMLQAQQSQINALLEEADEPAEPAQQPGAVGGVMGMLAGILNNPQVQDAIAAKAIGFLNTIIPDPSGKTMNMQPRAQLGSITQDDITALNIAVTKILENGATVQDFQRLAAMDKNKFDMALGVLRTL
jgi:hypothetical protein